MDSSDHGLSHNFKGSGAVVNGLTGIEVRWSNVCSFSIGAEYQFCVSP